MLLQQKSEQHAYLSEEMLWVQGGPRSCLVLLILPGDQKGGPKRFPSSPFSSPEEHRRTGLGPAPVFWSNLLLTRFQEMQPNKMCPASLVMWGQKTHGGTFLGSRTLPATYRLGRCLMGRKTSPTGFSRVQRRWGEDPVTQGSGAERMGTAEIGGSR